MEKLRIYHCGVFEDSDTPILFCGMPWTRIKGNVIQEWDPASVFANVAVKSVTEDTIRIHRYDWKKAKVCQKCYHSPQVQMIVLSRVAT